MEEGKCYDNALAAILSDARFYCETTRLVHGYPRLTAASSGYPVGTRYGHAWVEVGSGAGVVCFNICPDIEIPAAIYYKIGCIEDAYTRRYTKAEACELAEVFETTGPWVEACDMPPGTKFA